MPPGRIVSGGLIIGWVAPGAGTKSSSVADPAGFFVSFAFVFAFTGFSLASAVVV